MFVHIVNTVLYCKLRTFHSNNYLNILNTTMPIFRSKNATKKKGEAPQVTLDNKHTEKMREYHIQSTKQIPHLKAQRKELQKRLKESDDIDEQLACRNRIASLTAEIRQLKEDKMEYLLDNSECIFEYFENKKNIEISNLASAQPTNEACAKSTTMPQTTTFTSSTQPHQPHQPQISKNQKINEFFKIRPSAASVSASASATSTFTSFNSTSTQSALPLLHPCQSNSAIANSLETVQSVRVNPSQRYFNNIDETTIDVDTYMQISDLCPHCRIGEFISLEDEGIIICNRCRHFTSYLDENEKPSYKDPPKEVCYYAYKKINHFKEILAQFQAKETTNIPDDVISQIRHQIEKERLTADQLTYHVIKGIIKKLGLNHHYYEHISYIKNKLGIPPPVFSNELENTLCNLFMEIQAPYAKVCPDTRVNFLNYHYVLYKLCELLGEDTYLDNIPLLKDQDKLVEQDIIWAQICEELDWQFYPTCKN